eukprot:CAMPEP_0116902366 /NCGR_PEP_ID=MMETSP0467-20121206/9980_1 /TAXON_ID=283647 /ORGANISM="Mesodinium pulex, Strain SPMC105" /LENGTH=97 /DNA_ID=CAMNT_0004576205 /DNA_START=1049 /DNA_END=1342 /DNA_ORIENTATION=-
MNEEVKDKLTPFKFYLEPNSVKLIKLVPLNGKDDIAYSLKHKYKQILDDNDSQAEIQDLNETKNSLLPVKPRPKDNQAPEREYSDQEAVEWLFKKQK